MNIFLLTTVDKLLWKLSIMWYSCWIFNCPLPFISVKSITNFLIVSNVSLSSFLVHYSSIKNMSFHTSIKVSWDLLIALRQRTWSIISHESIYLVLAHHVKDEPFHASTKILWVLLTVWLQEDLNLDLFHVLFLRWI